MEGRGAAVETRKDNDKVFFIFVCVSVCVWSFGVKRFFIFFNKKWVLKT